MKPYTLLGPTLGIVLLSTLSSLAQDRGYWRAASKTSSSITGDVALAEAKITINLQSYSIAPIRSLKPEEAVAAFDADSSTPGSGSLYRLNIPGTVKLLHKNTLCGGEDTQWMVTYSTGKNLQIAFFSGAKPPVLTIDALGNSTDLCGTYSYVH